MGIRIELIKRKQTRNDHKTVENKIVATGVSRKYAKVFVQRVREYIRSISTRNTPRLRMTLTIVDIHREWRIITG